MDGAHGYYLSNAPYVWVHGGFKQVGSHYAPLAVSWVPGHLDIDGVDVVSAKIPNTTLPGLGRPQDGPNPLVSLNLQRPS